MFFHYIRFTGSFYSKLQSKVLKSLEKCSIRGVAAKRDNSAIYWKFVDTNGGLPWANSYMMHPTAHKSL